MYRNHTATRITVAAVAASALLTGCSSPSEPVSSTGGVEEATESSVSEGAASEARFDTGSFKTEPHSGWPRDNAKIGAIVEAMRIGSATLLPYEVDDSFARGGASNTLSFDGVQDVVSEPVFEALQPLADSYLTGYGRVGLQENIPHRAQQSLLRFKNPESAQQAAHIILETMLAQGGGISVPGDRQPLPAVEVPGQPEVLATMDASNGVMTSVRAVNEFVLLTETRNTAVPNGRQSPEDFEKELADIEWMPAYHAAFYTKQVPLIDTIPTHKTAEGVGMSDQWPEADPEELLRYTLMPAENTRRAYRTPSWANERLMAGNYTNVGERFRMFDQANITAMAQAETLVYRTANPQQAELLRATFSAEDAESEPQPYDEPQGVPGATCATFPTAHGTRYSCTLVYENYFVDAGVSEVDESLPDVGAEPSQESTPMPDAKTQLSQMVAAQYLLLTKAPKK